MVVDFGIVVAAMPAWCTVCAGLVDEKVDILYHRDPILDPALNLNRILVMDLIHSLAHTSKAVQVVFVVLVLSSIRSLS